MQTLVIDRKHWIRGGAQPGTLKNGKGNMCCLGFLGESLGATDAQLLNCPTPNASRDTRPDPHVNWVGHLDDKTFCFWTGEAILINDDQTLSDDERERRLIEHFVLRGIELSFTG